MLPINGVCIFEFGICRKPVKLFQLDESDYGGGDNNKNSTTSAQHMHVNRKESEGERERDF